MRTTHFSALIVMLTLGALAPRDALAAPPQKPTAGTSATSSSPPAPAVPPLSDALTGDAKADYEAGKVYFNDKDYSRAFLKFQEAYEKSKDPRLLWNMAACQKELRKYAKVVPLVERYLKEGDAQISADDKTRAEGLLNAIAAGTTTIAVEVNEPDADIFLDDEPLGKSPLAKPVLIDLGTRKLLVKKAGFDDFTQTVNAGGEKISVDVKLVRTMHEGTIAVHAGTNDMILIDDKVVGVGTFTGKLQSGPHVLRVTAPGMRPFQGDVLVTDNQVREVPVTLDRAETKLVVPTWVWVVGVGTVVAVGGTLGLYYAFKHDNTYNGPTGNLSPSFVELSRFIPRF